MFSAAAPVSGAGEAAAAPASAQASQLHSTACLGSAGTFMGGTCARSMARMLNVTDALMTDVADAAAAMHNVCTAQATEVCNSHGLAGACAATSVAQLGG